MYWPGEYGTGWSGITRTSARSQVSRRCSTTVADHDAGFSSAAAASCIARATMVNASAHARSTSGVHSGPRWFFSAASNAVPTAS